MAGVGSREPRAEIPDRHPSIVAHVHVVTFLYFNDARDGTRDFTLAKLVLCYTPRSPVGKSSF